MLVRDRMTPEPVCARPEMPVTEAQALMRQHDIRHLPVVNDQGHLVGLVTQRSLLKALPSDVSHFSRLEVGYVLARIKVRDVMVKDVIAIDPDTAIEEAARIMADRSIGCLPVVQDSQLSADRIPIGIITDNDLFTLMVDLLAARRPGVRVTVVQPDRPGEVARISAAIASQGGNLTAYVTYPTRRPHLWSSLFKVDNLPPDRVVETLNQLDGIEVLDVRET